MSQDQQDSDEFFYEDQASDEVDEVDEVYNDQISYIKEDIPMIHTEIYEDDDIIQSDVSASISIADAQEVLEIVQKKVKLEQENQLINLDELEAKLEQEDKMEKLEQKHNWRNKARSKLEILNQIKLGTDQTISILPQSLTEEEQVMLSISKAQRYNSSLVEFRKQLRDSFKDQDVHQLLSQQENLFPCNHIPVILSNSTSTVIIPPQNLFIRKGNVEQFIKINLDNEPNLQQLELQKRMGLNRIQKRKPYQKRIKPEL